MSVDKKAPTYAIAQALCVVLGTTLCATFFARSGNSQQRSPHGAPSPSFIGPSGFVHSDMTGGRSTTKRNLAIPPGTILPVRLNSTISSLKSKPGQVITGRMMQNVLLASGARIRERSTVVGHVVEVNPASAGGRGRVSFQFDKLISSHQTISISTHLRAIAGFMRIIEAQTPPIGPGESDVYRWLTTVQVGGDVVYGEGGPVTTSENANEVVGKSVDGGALGRVRAKEGTKCRGAIDGNDTPQALWVFSSDACGTYGLAHVRISHAGRSNPTGLIVLSSDAGNLVIPSGAGMILRVDDTNKSESAALAP